MDFSILIKIGIYAVALIFSAGVFLFVYRLLKKAEVGTQKAIGIIDENYKKAGELTDQKIKLSRSGIMYRFGDYNLNPSKYVALRLMVGIIVMAIMFVGGLGTFSLLGVIAGYIGTDLFFKFLNRRDNRDMEKDIYNTYANMKIQLSSGIYIADCLEYTFNTSKNKRYKEALSELILNMSDKTMTSYEAVQIFKNRFDSKQIKKLCSMLNTFVQYGISEVYIADIMTELQAVLTADTLRAEHDVETKTTFVTFILFTLIVIWVAIVMVQSFSGMDMFSM